MNQISENTKKELVYLKCDALLIQTEDVVKEAEDLGITDEQRFIDFEIKLSQLSTQDHFYNLNKKADTDDDGDDVKLTEEIY